MAADGSEICRLPEQGKTVVFVLLDGAPVAAIALAEIAWPESRAAIEGAQSHAPPLPHPDLPIRRDNADADLFR
jgi:hypothetical protein